ncbi:MAG: DUF4118 domain-containing protein [Fimbriimonadaceae bacterium]|nr:DUF4118 domain-containing protein [Chthonomonadaceae bacterium]MCO5296771.1 DUF4118 domain-containing protein [Fimbriimonadaceae bacterium]
MLERGTPAGYLWAGGVTAVATGACRLMYDRFDLSNLIMVYLVGVAFVASRFGPREAILASVLSVATFDFLFVTPHGTFAVSDMQYIVTFIVMLLVSLLISSLTLRVRRQARVSETLLKESQQARLQAEADRMRNTLLTSISHDLRTPLTSIAGAADTLRRGEGDTRALASNIYTETMHLNRQVQNLLDMTRLQWGELRLNCEWESLEELIGSALDRTEELLDSRKVKVHLEPDLPLVQADGALLERALINLFENAARHTPPEAEVEVRVERLADSLRVTVLDTGPGITPGNEEAVFEQFNQAAGNPIGFGLGLAICRAIITLHNGRIWAQNRPEGGAAFSFELPLAERQPEVRGG